MVAAYSLNAITRSPACRSRSASSERARSKASSGAAEMVSLWQANCLAIGALVYANWSPAPGAVAMMATV